MEETTKNIESVEKDLIDNITLKIASCRSDEEFEDSVNKYLCSLLTKLSSSYESVRTKILELLVHINKRLKSRPQVKLPVSQLLLQYQDPSATAFVNNFTIIYLKLGIPRISVEEQVKYIPMIIASLEGKASSQQDSLLLLLLPMLPLISSNKNECKKLFGFTEKQAAMKLFYDFAYDVLLMPYGYATPDLNSPATAPPPGMSDYAVKRIMMSEKPVTAEHLENLKCALVKICACGAFPASDVALHLIIAAADSRHSVATLADNELKRLNSEIDWNSSEMLNNFFQLFLGTKNSLKSSIRPEHQRTPANTRIRLKLLPLFTKSPESAKLIIPCVSTIFECLNGEESKANLKMKGLSLVSHFCTHCPENLFPSASAILLNEMKKLVFKSKTDSEDLKSFHTIRNMALIIIPKILVKNSLLLQKELSIVTQLLDFFKDPDIETQQDFKSSLRSALGDISPVLAKLVEVDSETKVILENVIQSYFEEKIPEVREVVVKYAAEVFPSQNVASKLVILLAFGDNNAEVRRLATDYLHVISNQDKPNFTDLMVFIKSKLPAMKNINITVEMVSYIHQCLETQLFSAKSHETFDQKFEKLKTFANQAFQERENKPLIWKSIILYVNWLKSLLMEKEHSSSINVSRFLLEVYSSLPKEAMISLLNASHTEKVLDAAKNESGESLDCLCQLVSLIVVNTFSEKQRDEFIDDLLEYTQSTTKYNEEKRVSALLSSAYVIVDLKLHKTDYLKKLVNISFTLLKDKKAGNTLKMTACKAIGEIGRSVDITELIGVEELKLAIVELIVASNLHLAESAVLGLCFLTIGFRGFDCRVFESIVDVLLEKGSNIAEVTFQFTLGDALCCVLNKSILNFKRINDLNTPFLIHYDEWQYEQTSRVVNLILEKYLVHSKRTIANAASVWSVCLLKQCGKLFKNCYNFVIKMQSSILKVYGNKKEKSEKQDKATEIVTTEIVEDITPKALKLMYEIVDEEHKKLLIKDLALIFSFAGSDSVNSSSSNIIALKEIQILVNESTEKPELFYEFVDVISFRLWGCGSKGSQYFYASTFQNRFKTIVERFYEKLIPKLFIGIHDPNSVTRTYMSFIWDAITSDSSKHKMLISNLDLISKEITSNLEDSFWKLREASCMALSEVLSLGANTMKDHLDSFVVFFEKLFKVCDDMKETVRIRAESAMKMLTRVSVDLCTAETVGKTTASKCVSVIVPVLVNSGINNAAKSIRKLSLLTLISVMESAGSSMKPFLPLVVPSLLEALTAFENQEINYLSVRLEVKTELHEMLDSVRVSSIHSSRIYGAIKQCIPHTDAGVLKELVPTLIDMIRTSVGLCTSAGCCFLIIELADRCPQDIRLYSGKIVKALLKNLTNRNVTVQKFNADAIGHIIKLLPDENVESLLVSYRDQYFTDDSKKGRHIIANFLSSVAKHSQDVVKKHSRIILPFAFYCMFETKPDEKQGTETVASVYEEIWLENTPGAETGVKLYFVEILDHIARGFESQLWLVKQQAASCLTSALEKIGKTIDECTIVKLINLLSSNLSGRTWEGKEKVLLALKTLLIGNFEAVNKLCEKGEVNISNVIEVMLRESRKENFTYKKSAMNYTSEVLSLYDNAKCDEFYSEVLKPLLLNDVEKKEKQKDDDDSDAKTELELCCVSLSAIKICWKRIQKHKEECIELISKLFRSGTYKVKQHSIIVVIAIIEATLVNEEYDKFLESLFNTSQDIVEDSLRVTRYSDLQSQGLELADVLLKTINEHSTKNYLRENFLTSVKIVSQESTNPQLKEKAASLLPRIQQQLSK